ncbi:glycosyltransferase family 32 protein [Suillus discolor]|uniref:Glycosyltransferase family 32 protein n=1 Tax=Suillus discolor TaxID=1912936 RepID=A0A9P7FAB0_9AGAM|nr:glycosyltransferase family 32 protein [Suillus discolor]KAG2109916.1 glycosyltransferase family 32 protein [Suillus discolor]
MVPVHEQARRTSSPWRKSPISYFSCLRPRRVFTLLKFALPLVFIICYTIYYLYDPRGHIDLVLYQREWIQREILPLSPLGGCFEPERVSPLYNISEAVYGKKRFEVQAGVTMRMGMDCYEFAGTVRFAEGEWTEEQRYIPPEERAQFHTYWRVDLAPLDERQEYMLKSFFATQDLPRSRLILWSNGDLSLNPIVQKYLELFPDSFALQVVDIPELAKGTAMENHHFLNLEDKKAWVDGDLVRLLVIWTYGGAWIDMDMLLTRDLSPLLEHEFVTQWDCYDKIYQAFNGALMHFRKHSPYLCEAFHLMAYSTPPRSPSTDWGAILYLRLWRRLLSESIPPFKILPFCLSDPLACRLDNSVPDPFDPDRRDGKWTGRPGEGLEEGGALEKALGKIFAVHLHNRWDRAFPQGGWVDRLLLRRYEEDIEKKVRIDSEL